MIERLPYFTWGVKMTTECEQFGMYTEIPTATTRKPIQRDIAKNTTDKKAKLKENSVNNPRGQEKGNRGTNRKK